MVETTNLVAPPEPEVIVGEVPVKLVLSVAVIVVVVPATECEVKITVAVPLASVVLVADENDPLASLFDQVMVFPEVLTGLLFAVSYTHLTLPTNREV